VFLQFLACGFQVTHGQQIAVGKHFVRFFETLQPKIRDKHTPKHIIRKFNKLGGYGRCVKGLHFFLGNDHGLDIFLVYDAGDALNEHLGSGVILKALDARRFVQFASGVGHRVYVLNEKMYICLYFFI